MTGQTHWQDVYSRKSPLEVSWYQPEATTSLALIARTGLGPDAAIDVHLRVRAVAQHPARGGSEGGERSGRQ